MEKAFLCIMLHIQDSGSSGEGKARVIGFGLGDTGQSEKAGPTALNGHRPARLNRLY